MEREEAELEYTADEGISFNQPISGKFEKGDKLIATREVADVLLKSGYFKELGKTGKAKKKEASIKEDKIEEVNKEDDI